MIVWSIFAFQYYTGHGFIVNTIDEDLDRVGTFANNVLDIPSSYDVVIDKVQRIFNEIALEILQILPIGDSITPHIDCVTNIIATLPDINVISNFAYDLNESLSTLPSFKEFDYLSTNITKWLDKMKYQDLAEIKEQLKVSIEIIQSISPKLEILLLEMVQIDIMKSLAPPQDEIDDVRMIINQIGYVQDNLLTNTFVDELNDQLNDIHSYNANEIAANIKIFQNAINVLSTIDFNFLNTTFEKFGNVKKFIPDTEKIFTILDDLSMIFNEFDLSGVDNSLIQLNVSIYGLINVIEGIDDLLDRLNLTILSMIPDFSPLFIELNKINIAFSISICFSDLIEMLYDVNNTIIILPPSVLDILTMIGDMKDFIKDINIDEKIGSINEMKDIVNGQLQNAISSVGNYTNPDRIIDLLPDVQEIQDDLDSVVVDFNTGSMEFNISKLVDDVITMNNSLSGLPNIEEFQKKISNAENSTNYARSHNSTFNQTIVGMEVIGNVPCSYPCPLADQTSLINELLLSVSESLNSVPSNDLHDVLNKFNETFDELSSSEDFITNIKELNTTLNGIPDLKEIIEIVNEANDTLKRGLPFEDFSNLIEQFSNSITDFNMNDIAENLIGDEDSSVNTMYSLIDHFLSFLETFTSINQLINPILESTILLFHSYDDELEGILGFLQNVKEKIEYGISVKDEVFNNIYKYDGYRLLAAFLFILLLVPVPCLGFYCCSCHRKPCCLLILSSCLILPTLFLSVLPIIGIPIIYVIQWRHMLAMH